MIRPLIALLTLIRANVPHYLFHQREQKMVGVQMRARMAGLLGIKTIALLWEGAVGFEPDGCGKSGLNGVDNIKLRDEN